MTSKEKSKLKMRDNYLANPEFYKQRAKELRKAQTLKGLCQNCNKPKLENSQLCEEHYLKQKSVHQLGTTSYWKELKLKLDLQQNKCFYTGEDLVLGLNTSLDHIIPKTVNSSLSGSLDNIQWVTTKINLIKNDMTHDQFVSLCKFISDKFN